MSLHLPLLWCGQLSGCKIYARTWLKESRKQTGKKKPKNMSTKRKTLVTESLVTGISAYNKHYNNKTISSWEQPLIAPL